MGPVDEVLYKCESCGHEWEDEPPLFSTIHACEVQGCTGKAYPKDESVSPSGIEKKDD